ncbi:ABC transporter ATP-binding protein [Actinophytocola sp.]|uniref:ABC transporter ATP-binding protein n=1 Tax=Actinophytocola sp. TaxID=1872138 RepID=UPI003D6BED36
MLEARGLRKTFTRGNGVEVTPVDNLSFAVEEGEFIVLLGPSGCGKTTLLRTLSGLEDPEEGDILIGGEALFSSSDRVNVPPESRPVGMVFQAYALWPHMKVLDNIAFPLRSAGVNRREAGQRVNGMLEMLGLTGVAGQYPGQISGGQQQRVALARALVAGDSLVLFDEPLSNVDAKVRQKLRVQLLEEQRKLGFTAIYVTHDQEEALSLATRVAVMRDGRFEQFAPPQEVYYRPATRYVADFVGSANLVAGEVQEQHGDSLVVRTAHGATTAATADPSVFPRGSKVELISRPERWHISTQPAASGPDRAFPLSKGRVEQSMFTSGRMEYLVHAGGEHIRVWADGERIIETGSEVWIGCDSFWAIPQEEASVESRAQSVLEK